MRRFIAIGLLAGLPVLAGGKATIEAQGAREAFRTLPAADRAALLAFLKSL
jgi:CxxC motif-containing protein (DUF1111 family)